MPQTPVDQPLHALIGIQERHPGNGMLEDVPTVQLKTGHVLLQVHLKRIGKKDSLICQRCHKAEEMVRHYLTECEAFATQRGCMERQLWRAAKSISTLLTNPKAFACLFRFIHDTGRFQGTQDKS